MAEAIRDADASMARDGFAPRARTGEAHLDVAVAEALQCQACGNLGHDLRAYSRPGRGYRAIAICQGCKRLEEL